MDTQTQEPKTVTVDLRTKYLVNGERQPHLDRVFPIALPVPDDLPGAEGRIRWRMGFGLTETLDRQEATTVQSRAEKYPIGISMDASDPRAAQESA